MRIGQEIVQIVANILLVLLIPATIVTAGALRELHRVHGPDVMGPAFFVVVGGGARWVVAAVALALIITCGRFEGLVSVVPLQVLLVYAAFALVDAAAGYAISAMASRDAAAHSVSTTFGQVVGFGLPLLVIVLLIVRLNVGAPGAVATRSLFVSLVLIAGVSLPVYATLLASAKAEQKQRIHEYWARQQQLVTQGTTELAALPADPPLEKLLPYLVDEWPPDVRSEAFARLENRSGINAELLAMFPGPNRDLALAYLMQMPGEASPTLAESVRDALLRQGDQWLALAGSGSALTDDQASKMSRQSEQASSLSYKFRESGIDYRRVADLWQRIADGALPRESPNVKSVQTTVLLWKAMLDREVPASAPSAQSAPAAPLHPTN